MFSSALLAPWMYVAGIIVKQQQTPTSLYLMTNIVEITNKFILHVFRFCILSYLVSCSKIYILLHITKKVQINSEFHFHFTCFIVTGQLTVKNLHMKWYTET